MNREDELARATMLTRIQALLDATDEEIEHLKADCEIVAEKAGISPAQVANTVFFLAQGGWNITLGRQR